MPWYRTGTVSVTLDSNAVIGTGTAFVANSRVGDAFLGPDGGWYEVTNIASDTAMSIAPPYRGATNGAGAYSLTPVQGYTKDLADQARAMIQQWGSTLAGLGSVSTENIVPVAKGGTGGATPAAARTGLQLGTAAVAALVGTVSQSGGVPTGAVIERGSNASGKYTKFADGTMICYQNRVPIAATANVAASINPGYAALFSELPLFIAGIEYPATNDNINISRLTGIGNTTGAGIIQLKADVTQTYMVGFFALGRWF